jgi:hypothetical protein
MVGRGLETGFGSQIASVSLYRSPSKLKRFSVQRPSTTFSHSLVRA